MVNLSSQLAIAVMSGTVGFADVVPQRVSLEYLCLG